MSEVHLAAERMIEAVHAVSPLSAGEAAHLLECAECRREWALVEAAARLGVGLTSRLEPGDLAARVVRRLREQPAEAVRPIRRFGPWIVGIAAAAALVVAAILTVPRHGTPGQTDMGQTASVLPELDHLTASELEAVLETIPVGADEHVEEAPLGDLDAKGLERLLRSLEG